MAISTGYDYGVRQGLAGKGVQNQDIGYNPNSGFVTVKGQNFMKPQKMYQGTSFTTQPDFNTAWDTYSKQQQAPAMGATVGVGQGAMQGAPMTAQQPISGMGAVAGVGNTAAQTPYQQPTQTQATPPADNQLNDLIQMLLQQAQNPTPTDVNAIYGSPQWAAQQAQAQRSAQQGIRAAQESMGSAGFGRSTALGERAQGIQNQATEYLQTQVLPQLMAAQQQERQQQLQNQMAMLDVLSRQKSEADQLALQQEQLGLQRGQLTGTLYSQQEQAAQPLLNRLTSLGEAWKTGTPEQKSTASTEANQIRDQLSQMGIDPSLYDPSLTTEQRREAVGGLGTQTLAARESAQQMEFQQAQQEWENMFAQAQFDESNAARIWEQAFKEKDFAQSVEDSAASRGLQWANLNQRDKEFVADQAFREKQFEYQKEQDLLSESEEQSVKVDPKFSTDNYNNLYDDLNSTALEDKAKELGVTTKEAARMLIGNNKDELIDSDYKKLNDWINDNL